MSFTVLQDDIFFIRLKSSDLGVSHFAFGRADYDFNDGLVLGRGMVELPYIGLKILKLHLFQIVMAR